jgi:hypothetical protein
LVVLPGAVEGANQSAHDLRIALDADLDEHAHVPPLPGGQRLRVPVDRRVQDRREFFDRVLAALGSTAA